MTTSSSIPKTMKAQVLTRHGGYEALEYRTDYPVPSVGEHQVLIRVTACGMNNTDMNTRIGWYAKEVTSGTTEAMQQDQQLEEGGYDGGIYFPRIQGGDGVGRVVAVGDSVDEKDRKRLTGRRVMVDPVERDWFGNDDAMNDVQSTKYMGSGFDGGFAEFLVALVKNVYPIDPSNDKGQEQPLSYSDAELATFAISYTTAENMLSRANVTEKDTVLIPGASGGVGSALIQLAKRRGAKVVAMASVSKHEQIRALLQPTALLPRSVDNLSEALKQAIGQEKVSVVADIVGGKDLFPALLDVLEHGVGRYVCSGAIAGPIVPLDLRTLYLHDITFYGCTIYPPHIFGNLCSYIQAGETKPLLAATFPLSDMVEAQKKFVEKKHIGNIVITI